MDLTQSRSQHDHTPQLRRRRPGAPFINRGRFQLFAQSQTQYSARAIDLMKRAIVMDMLSPMTLNFPLQDKWNVNPERSRRRSSAITTPASTSSTSRWAWAARIAYLTRGCGSSPSGTRFIAGTTSHLMRIDSAGRLRARQGLGQDRRAASACRTPSTSAVPTTSTLLQPRPAGVAAHVQLAQPDRQRLDRAARRRASATSASRSSSG